MSTNPTMTSIPRSFVFAVKKTYLHITKKMSTRPPSFHVEINKLSPGNTCDVNLAYIAFNLFPSPLQKTRTIALAEIPYEHKPWRIGFSKFPMAAMF